MWKSSEEKDCKFFLVFYVHASHIEVCVPTLPYAKHLLCAASTFDGSFWYKTFTISNGHRVTHLKKSSGFR